MSVNKSDIVDSVALLIMIKQGRREYIKGESKEAQQAFSDIRSKTTSRLTTNVKKRPITDG